MLKGILYIIKTYLDRTDAGAMGSHCVFHNSLVLYEGERHVFQDDKQFRGLRESFKSNENNFKKLQSQIK